MTGASTWSMTCCAGSARWPGSSRRRGQHSGVRGTARPDHAGPDRLQAAPCAGGHEPAARGDQLPIVPQAWMGHLPGACPGPGGSRPRGSDEQPEPGGGNVGPCQGMLRHGAQVQHDGPSAMTHNGIGTGMLALPLSSGLPPLPGHWRDHLGPSELPLRARALALADQLVVPITSLGAGAGLLGRRWPFSLGAGVVDERLVAQSRPGRCRWLTALQVSR